MDRFSKDCTRKEALANLFVLPALAGVMAAGATGMVQAAANNQAQFKYQNHPNGKAECMGCSLFVPGKSATANGTCKVVTGSISPKGWCTAYAPKS